MKPITYDKWKTEAARLDERARNYERMVSERARAEFNAAFGYGQGTGRALTFECFLYAHNWQGQNWLTPAQNRVCRLVNWLSLERWNAHRVVDRIQRNLWKRVAR